MPRDGERDALDETAKARALAAGVVLWFALCLALAGPTAAQTEGELVLGMSAAFTGPSRGLGIELYRGSVAYFERLNRQGGVNGRKVVIDARDDGYQPLPAIMNTLDFIQQNRTLALFNYVGTPTVTRVLPLIKLNGAAGWLLFFPFTGAQPQREPPYEECVFNLRASYRQETQGLVDHLTAVGRKRIAVFHQADAYGRSGWDGLRRALSRLGLGLASEATYTRGAAFGESMLEQVDILKRGKPDAVVCVGAYAACAAFIRDARDSGLDVPIANLSFVGSENLLGLLERAGAARGRDYTAGLLNTQVVPSYEDLRLPAVREYRALMDEMDPAPPAVADVEGYSPLRYSFVSFEGYFNAKVMAHILGLMGPDVARSRMAAATESVKDMDIGIDEPVSFSPSRRQGLNAVYFTTVREGKFAPVTDWSEWAK